MSNLNVESSSYLAISPKGRIEMLVDRIEDGYVFAKCYLFANRTDEAPIVSEMSLAEIPENAGNELGLICSKAMDMAYESAVRRIAGSVGFYLPTEKPTVSIENEEKVTNVTNDPIAKVETEVSDIPESTEEEPDPTENSIVIKLDLTGKDATTEESSTPSEENYLDFKLELLGKPHECYGWTIRKLLEERPDVIVSFYPRYSGRNEEAKAALKAAYSDALRRQEEIEKQKKSA